MHFNLPCPENKYLAEHAELLLSSFARLSGKHLINPELPDFERYRALYEADFCVLSDNTDADPVFTYGNRITLELFEMDWETFTRLPSRKSAEPQVRDERARLMQQVAEKGFIDDYRGVRISATGKRFWVEDAIVWNLIDARDNCLGRAAVLYRWSAL